MIVLFFSYAGFAQFHQYRNYNVRDGLPSSEVYNMMQDVSGYLWFSTDMGVSRFDGYQFRNYSTENGLPDNTIFGLYQDLKGRIWFRSFSGKLSYFYKESIYTLPCNALLENKMKGSFMTSLYVDEGDTIWAGTTKNYVLKINPGWKDSEVKRIDLPEPDGYLCLIGKTGFIYGGGFKPATNMSVYQRVEKKLYTLPLFSSIKEPTRIRYSVTRLRDGNFLITANELIVRCNSRGIISREKMGAIGICTFEDENGDVLAGTYDGVFDWSGPITSNDKQYLSFKQKVVTAVYRDRENELWFCTEGNGIFCIPHRNFLYYTPPDGLSESKISCVSVCGKKVLAGHLDGSISILEDTDVKSISPENKTAFPGSTSRISSLLCLNKTEVLGSTGNSLYSINPLEPASKFVFSVGGKKFISSSDGNIWALRYRSIVKHDAKSFRALKNIPFNIFADNIYEDRLGKLWICAINGLWTYDDVSGLQYLGTNNPLLASRIVDMREDADGNLWMVSRGNGLIVKKGEVFFHITETNGLAGNMCRTLLIDPDNIVWVGTNSGLSRISFSFQNEFSYSIRNFYSQNGLLTNEVNNIIRMGDKIWVVHTNGISVFDPGTLLSNVNPPPVYIISTIVDGDTISSDNQQFEYNQNYFNISFVGLSFKDPGHLIYQYKMEGVDSGWVSTNYTSVKYQTLPPGHYRFLATAENNDGYRSKTPAEISFTILPAWWQTWYFKIGLTCIGFLLILLIFKLRLNKVRKRERKKTAFQNRIATFELNALRAQMNPHFVFNAINSVQYFITNNDPDSSQKYLSKFARLIRYVVDNSKLASIPLKKEIEALTLYLELESLRFEPHFEYEIRVNPNIDTEYIQIPSMIIQPYVENAIWHGIMHKKGNGRIDIRMEMKGDILYCEIEDNGIGRKRSLELKKENDTQSHQSVGMSNTRDRLEIINQVNNSNLSVQITDLYSEAGKPCGTKVKIHIPTA